MDKDLHIDSQIEGYKGLLLHTRKWMIPEAKADIAFVHGFFEHCGRYANEAKYCNKAGYNFLAYDQRSHGLSEGRYRSYVSDFNDYAQDFELFIKSTNLGKERPYYLFAHSMGGLVLCNHLVHNSFLPEGFMGAIFSAPLLAPDPNTAPLLQKISGIVGTLLPRLKAVAIDATAVSRDPLEVEKYVNDPLNYIDKMYAASGYNLLKQMKIVQSKFSDLKTPFLVLHGTDDKLSDISGSRLLFAKAASEDKQFIELKDFKHEITKDLGHENVLKTITHWMDNRLS